MKYRTIISLALLLLAFCAWASGVDYVEQGNKAYESKQYKKATQMYEHALTDGESSVLRYNLGNAYYRLNDRANAILNYERALKLDPGNSDARYNLELVNEKSKLNPSNGSNFFSSILSNWVSRFSSNTWAVTALILFVMMLAGIACYRIAGSVALQKMGFFGAIVLGILALLAIGCSYYVYQRCSKCNFAIVMTDKAPVNKSPREGENEEKFNLPSGSKIEVIDSISNNKNDKTGKWYKIETLNEKTGWMKKTDIEKI